MSPTLPVRVLPGVVGMLAVLAALGRLFPDYVFHWDEVQLTLGLEQFDLRSHQPHPPGYYLFVLLGRLLRPLAATPEDALRWVAALGGAALVAPIAWWLPPNVRPWARVGYVAAAAAFVLCSPLVLFHSVSALTYTAEAACWLAILLAVGARPAGARLLLLAAGIGLAGGIRQTLVVWGLALVAIAWLLDRRWLDGRAALRLLAALVAGVAVWMVPMLVEVGGIGEYATATGPMLRGNVWEKSIVHEGLAAAWARVPRMLVDTWLAAGLLLPAAAAGLAARCLPRFRASLARWDLLPIGAALPFLFYTLVIYDSDGYILVVAAPLAAWGLLSLATIFQRRRGRDQLVGALVALGLALGTLPAGRASAPGRGYRSYALHDARLEARIGAIRRAFKPADTVLVTSHEYWEWSFRHVMYYLREYTTLQLIPDRFYVDAGPARPYLTARDHVVRFSGPDGLNVAELGESIRQVVYVIPHDVTRFVAPSCAHLIRPFPVTASETLGVLRGSEAYEVRISRAQLHCVPAGAGAPG